MTPAEETESPEERAKANAALIRRMAGGDKDALAELYDKLSKPLFATARHILNDAADARRAERAHRIDDEVRSGVLRVRVHPERRTRIPGVQDLRIDRDYPRATVRPGRDPQAGQLQVGAQRFVDMDGQ